MKSFPLHERRARVLWGLGLAAALAAVTAASALYGRVSLTGEPPSFVSPATGQTQSFGADLADGRPGAVPVPDDGRVRRGAALRYRDNGDGTVTDLNTGLVWEQKCSGCNGLHDVGAQYRWSGDGTAPTIWDWLAQVNGEGERGLAGRSDWRIPNVTELLSIVDYGARMPAVSGDITSEAAEYWTSTTFADFPAHALVVYFGMGLVNDRLKTGLHHVRAVRGTHGEDAQASASDERGTERFREATAATPLPATGQTQSYGAATEASAGTIVSVPDDGRLRSGRSPGFRDNGDGTLSDLRTGLMWEKKCAGCGGLHDVDLALAWSGNGEQTTVWDWQASVNAEGGGGFAGQSDWRIPNVKELQSIVDYERFNPAVAAAFDGGLCGLGCADAAAAACSCTRMSAYWSSTTFGAEPSSAVAVAFHLGLVEPRPKNETAYVRAVRGGLLAAETRDKLPE